MLMGKMYQFSRFHQACILTGLLAAHSKISVSHQCPEASAAKVYSCLSGGCSCLAPRATKCHLGPETSCCPSLQFVKGNQKAGYLYEILGFPNVANKCIWKSNSLFAKENMSVGQIPHASQQLRPLLDRALIFIFSYKKESFITEREMCSKVMHSIFQSYLCF